MYISGKNNDTSSRKTASPRFPPEFWSGRCSTLNKNPRTSNSIEGFHNKFNNLLKGGSNLKFYSVLKTFQEEEQSTTALYLDHLQGHSSTRRNKATEARDSKLKTILTSREDSEMFDHIQALALILQKL